MALGDRIADGQARRFVEKPGEKESGSYRAEHAGASSESKGHQNDNQKEWNRQDRLERACIEEWDQTSGGDGAAYRS